MGWYRLTRCLRERCRLVHSRIHPGSNLPRQTRNIASALTQIQTHPNARNLHRHYTANVGTPALRGFPDVVQHSAPRPGRVHTEVYKPADSGSEEFHSRYQDAMTVAECVETTQELFRQSLISEPAESAVYLIAFSLGYKTLSSVRMTRKVTADEIKILLPLVARRLTRLPVQYVIGEWDFRSLTLHLAPPVLIPRPETEELVSLILSHHHLLTNCSFLEVGSGSGAICCSILAERPQWTCKVVELSQDACALTGRNAELVGVADRMQIYNLAIHKYDLDSSSGKCDFLVSNPPYILTKDMHKLQPEISYEDPVALDGGKDGLDVVRDILEVAPRVVRPGGTVWLEVDSSHPPLIMDLVAPSDGCLRYCATHRDFNAIPRFCELRVKPVNMTAPT